MLTLFALMLSQAGGPDPLKVAIQAGTHPEYQRAVASLGQSLAVGDAAKASHFAGLLPKGSIVVGWDDTGVPADRREAFANARDAAIQLWTSGVPTLQIKIGANPDVLFRFVPKPAEGKRLLDLQFGESPRIVAAISLSRFGSEAADRDVTTDVTRALGEYLGVAESPLPGTAMQPNDTPLTLALPPTPRELVLAQNTLRLANTIREAMAGNRPIVLTTAQVKTDKDRFDLGSANQGALLQLELNVTNSGAGNLRYRLVPDCGCFSPVTPGEVAAGQSKTLRFTMRTIDYRGSIDKKLVLFTNDPVEPAKELPVHVDVVPAFRFLRPEGDVVILPDGGGTFDVFLAVPERTKLTAKAATIAGLFGKASLSPWEGSLPDPDLGEGPVQRKGYRVRVRLDDNLPPGRSPATITVTTDNEQFPEVRYTLYAQKGIVALPDSLYWGELGSRPKKADILISRPGKDFQVLGVTSALKNLTVSVKPVRGNQEYKVEVQYDGKAAFGDLSGDIIVRTNDPKQPRISVPVIATVSR